MPGEDVSGWAVAELGGFWPGAIVVTDRPFVGGQRLGVFLGDQRRVAWFDGSLFDVGADKRLDLALGPDDPEGANAAVLARRVARLGPFVDPCYPRIDPAEVPTNLHGKPELTVRLALWAARLRRLARAVDTPVGDVGVPAFHQGAPGNWVLGRDEHWDGTIFAADVEDSDYDGRPQFRRAPALATVGDDPDAALTACEAAVGIAAEVTR